MGWITDVYEQAKSIVQTAGTSLDELVTNIDSVKFDSTNTLYQFVGMVKYVVGDVMFGLLCVSMYVGLLVSMYRLIIIVVNIVSNLIPGMKGKMVIK